MWSARTEADKKKANAMAMDYVEIKHHNGAKARIYIHGAHLTSWTLANGDEQIFLSKKAIFKPPKVCK